MAGKLIMPKHTGQRTEFEAVLKVHYNKNGWMTSAELKDALHEEYVHQGLETVRKSDETDYTKDAQLPRYFGLIERPIGKESKSDAETRITQAGKECYEALQSEDWNKVHAILVNAFMTLSFGRNTQGCGSDSDCEPLGIFFRAAYALDGLSNKEYGFLLAEMDEKGRSFASVIDELRRMRSDGTVPSLPPKNLASNLADAKALVLLKELKLLDDGNDRKRVSSSIDPQLHLRLLSLPLCNLSTMNNKYLAAIRTKPFILLAGISGTGKSRMVRQLARGCCPRYKEGSTTEEHPLYNEQKPGNFEMIQVRPNWHDSTELMGYVTRITASNTPEYVLTDFVRFLAKAWLFPNIPFFLCLDEMNLAPVEQYFAEYLSVIETRRKNAAGTIETDVLVKFPPETAENAIKALLSPYEPPTPGFAKAEVDNLRKAWKKDGGLRIPPNFVVMGTVNMDETTCTFSRKVLDRAMSFELNDVKMRDGLGGGEASVDPIPPAGALASRLKPADFYAGNEALCDAVIGFLEAVNTALDKTPFKIAYRTRDEVMLYCLERVEGGTRSTPPAPSSSPSLSEGRGDGEDVAQSETVRPEVSPSPSPLTLALDEAASMKILSRIEGDETAMRVPKDYVAASGSGDKNAPKNLLRLLRNTILSKLAGIDGAKFNDETKPDFDALAKTYPVCASKLDEMEDRLSTGYTGFWR